MVDINSSLMKGDPPPVDVNSPHWMWESPAPHMPELLLLGRREVREASPLGYHSHEEAYEFVLIEKGKASWEVDGEEHDTGAGDVFYTRPGEVHNARYNVIEPCQFWWLQLRAPFLGQHTLPWLGLSRSETLELARAIEALPRVSAVTPEAPKWMAKLSQALMRSDPLSRLEQRVLVLQFLLALVQGQPRAPGQSQNARLVRTVIQWLEANLSERCTVEELAGLINVSPSHFHRLFRQETGLTPMAYAERLRCREACRRLEATDEPITKIAVDLGYATSQHFATVFRRIMGRTPTEWRHMRKDRGPE